jgi:hypothetical protein
MFDFCRPVVYHRIKGGDGLSKKGFIVHHDWEESLRELDDRELREVIMAMFRFNKRGTVPKLTGKAKQAFIPIRQCHERHNEKWREVSRVRAEAGRRGGQTAQANARFASSKQANQAVNGKDNDNANGSVNGVVRRDAGGGGAYERNKKVLERIKDAAGMQGTANH